MSRALLLMLLALGAGAAEDLAQRARARQVAAEDQLAAGRSARLTERAALAERRHAATRELARLDARRRELAAQLEAQRGELAATRQRVRQRERIADQLRDSLLGAYGVDATSAIAPALETMLDQFAAAAELRLAPETVIDRGGRPVEVPVLRLGAAGAIAAGDEARTAGLLVLEPGARPRVGGPLLSAERRAALAAFAAGRPASIPLDVDGSLATRETPAAWSLGGWFADGGIFAWPILGVTLLALLIACERAVSLARLRTSAGLAERTLAAVRGEGPSAAAALVADGRTPMARVLRAGLALFGVERERLEAGLEAALLEEEPRFERSLTLLAACAAVAPLLGLLGTVTGMIGTFDVIAVHGTGNPRLLSGGISEALVTTQMGLLAAVPILLCHAALSRAVDRRQVRLEQAATALVASREEPA